MCNAYHFPAGTSGPDACGHTTSQRRKEESYSIMGPPNRPNFGLTTPWLAVTKGQRKDEGCLPVSVNRSYGGAHPICVSLSLWQKERRHRQAVLGCASAHNLAEDRIHAMPRDQSIRKKGVHCGVPEPTLKYIPLIPIPPGPILPKKSWRVSLCWVANPFIDSKMVIKLFLLLSTLR